MTTPHRSRVLAGVAGLLLAGSLHPALAAPLAAVPHAAAGRWAAAGAMVMDRAAHTATLLTGPACVPVTRPTYCGEVLVTGGHFQGTTSPGGPPELFNAELFNPWTGQWRPTGSLHVYREGHTATLLADGRVLVVGGGWPSAEIYDPAAATWTMAGLMTTARSYQTATLLAGPACATANPPRYCGDVLVVGGQTPDPVNGTSPFAELFDPRTISWTPAGGPVGLLSLVSHTATLLADGRVLVAGGATILAGDSSGYSAAEATAAIYDPASAQWSLTAPMSQPRTDHTATLLDGPACHAAAPPAWCGDVLVTGGKAAGMVLSNTYAPPTLTTEVFDPGAARWTPAAPMSVPRAAHTATLLDDGTVLVTGGFSVAPDAAAPTTTPLITASSEIWDPSGYAPASGALGTWSGAGSMTVGREQHTATLLTSPACHDRMPPRTCGAVLAAGGLAPNDLTSTPIYVSTRAVDLWSPPHASGATSSHATRSGAIRGSHRGALGVQRPLQAF